jgi:hypothetical protein
MAKKHLNKYRFASHRRKGWDFSRHGMYFITIVTQGRKCNLGHINPQHQIDLSDFGKIPRDFSNLLDFGKVYPILLSERR